VERIMNLSKLARPFLFTLVLAGGAAIVACGSGGAEDQESIESDEPVATINASASSESGVTKWQLARQGDKRITRGYDNKGRVVGEIAMSTGKSRDGLRTATTVVSLASGERATVTADEKGNVLAKDDAKLTPRGKDLVKRMMNDLKAYEKKGADVDVEYGLAECAAAGAAQTAACASILVSCTAGCLALCLPCAISLGSCLAATLATGLACDPNRR
jgi:hypothetical protein